MNDLISKSDFKKFQQCPEYFWFYKNRPEVLQEKEISDFEKALSGQGKKVEQQFYLLFPGLKIIASKGIDSLDETKSLDQASNAYVGQAAFAAEGFFAQSDLVHFRGDKEIDIYEVKSGSSSQSSGPDENGQAPSREEYLDDLTFQYIVAMKASYHVENTFLVELNKEYIRHGETDLEMLFNITDVTVDIQQRATGIGQLMDKARTKSNESLQPSTCECKYKARKNQCLAFPYLHPEMMGYTVHDLARIGSSKKRLREMIDSNIIRIEDIPADYDLTDSCRDQVLSWNNHVEIIHREEILNAQGELEYPLYFLDYETYSPAVPLFDGTRPYQHLPFQYSLHILKEPDVDPDHREFLHMDRTNPMEYISRQLRSDIGDTGTVIVWNKKFEGMCNTSLAEAVPELAHFLHGINRRFFDLMEIFSKKMFVNKDFRGSSSIKKVLPVLVPDLSYNVLDIGDGGMATTAWNSMVFELSDDEEKQTIRRQLLEYCRMDTLAMVEVYRKVNEKIR